MSDAINDNSFSKQTDLVNKRHSDLEDDERIYLLKREIDNLRGQIRKSGVIIDETAVAAVVPPTTRTASNGGRCTSPMCRAPLLSMMLVVGLAMIAKWRRRRTTTASTIANRAPELTMHFELPDAHEYEAPSTEIQFV
jgi:hypothetical protein